MFITTLPELARLLFYAFLLGIAFGVLYDGFRIVKVAVLGTGRQDQKPNTAKRLKKAEIPGFLLHFFTDLLFFGIAAVVTVLFTYAFHRGKVRLSAVFSIAAGFFAYYFTVGRLVYSLAELIVTTVRRAIRFATRFVYAHTLLPLGRAAKKLLCRLFTALRSRILRKKRLTASKKEEERFLKLAEQGFGIGEEHILRL